MYFRNIPNIKYDVKPSKYPFSEAEYVIAKNFFRRYEINPDIFSYSVIFKKYAIEEGMRIDSLAEKAYGDAELDWVIILTNNIVNPLFDWPMSGDVLRRYCESNYTNPYEETHHYETYEYLDSFGNLVLPGGLIVDEEFYNSAFTFWNGTTVSSVPGYQVCKEVSVFEHEENLNEKKREIYLLKGEYISEFIDEFKKQNLYKPSSDYISLTEKKTGV